MAEHLSDEQVDDLVRLVDNIAAEQPYALDELVGTVEHIREEVVLAWQATLDKTVDEANRQLARHDADIAAAKAAGAAEVIARLLPHWTTCWCGPQEREDHDPRLRDCPIHGSDDCRHMAEGFAADLRAALTTGGEGRE